MTKAELAVILLADPPVPDAQSVSLTEKSIHLTFDPARFFFRPELSGLLCDFAQNASCPDPIAQPGSMLASDLPYLGDLQFGTLRPLHTLDVAYDNGLGSVDVIFNTNHGQPLTFDTPGDRNWFAFYFEPTVLYDPFLTLVTNHHDQEGDYTFTQLGAGCVTSVPGTTCSSDMPSFGISLAPVPEPAALAMWLGGLAGIAAWVSRARKGRQRDQARATRT